jgi:hypothetical protein
MNIEEPTLLDEELLFCEQGTFKNKWYDGGEGELDMRIKPRI